ncbi:MAG: flagellar hook assembly protein FlgD [Candidatus Rokubacteria bacterium]|nr:flagellar hook assembly protein FlgD [Candidatus Rokubacteria bacterium]MBI4593696.1 flagellar hook assembly protein FlgD [Candidatus Rokubacteria bacterium]
MALPLVPIIGAVAGAITNAVSKPPDRLGKDDFLKLLVAQLKNQNPLNPLANDQFISQSAAFSSLEALQNIQKGVEGLGSGSGTALAGAASLLGRPVAATAGRFTFAGAPVSLPYTITAPVGDAALEVTDAGGALVSRTALGAKGAGQYATIFTSPAGRVLPNGDYRYRIVSMDGGRSTPLSAIAGSVTGITLVGGQPVLQVGSVTVSLSDVTTIGTPTN